MAASLSPKSESVADLEKLASPRPRIPSYSGVRLLQPNEDGEAKDGTEQSPSSALEAMAPASTLRERPRTEQDWTLPCEDRTRAYTRADLTNLSLPPELELGGGQELAVPSQSRPGKLPIKEAPSRAAPTPPRQAASPKTVDTDSERFATTAARKRPTSPRSTFTTGFTWAGFGVIGLTLGLAWSRFPSAESTPSPVSVKPTAAVEVAGPKTVVASFTATPAGAQIFLDGLPLSNPFRLVHAMDGASHDIRAEAPGYNSLSIPIRFDRDVTVSLDLDRIAVPSRDNAEALAPLERTKKKGAHH